MTSASLIERAHADGVADDPAARPRRLTFNAGSKAASSLSMTPCRWRRERRALLRREGLDSDAVAPKARPSKRSPEQVEREKLRRGTAGLEAQLTRTRLALEITGEAHALLEMLSDSADTEPSPKP